MGYTPPIVGQTFTLNQKIEGPASISNKFGEQDHGTVLIGHVRHSFLPWYEGLISTIKTNDLPVLSGPFTGCLFCISGDKAYHVHTQKIEVGRISMSKSSCRLPEWKAANIKDRDNQWKPLDFIPNKKVDEDVFAVMFVDGNITRRYAIKAKILVKGQKTITYKIEDVTSVNGG